MFKKLSLPGLLLAGVMTFLSAPGGNVAASECGGDGGNLCWADQACISIWIYKQCTTRYKYYEGE